MIFLCKYEVPLKKRAFDVICALIGLILLAPVFMLVALLIAAESRGGIFFLQRRVGQHGRIFEIVKFRTMHVNSGSKLTSGNSDSRITKVGGYIRKLHLDELIQLVNVLKGDMSLVGMRPEIELYTQYYPEKWQKILQLKPGIAGLAALKYSRFEYEKLENADDKDQVYIKEVLPLKLDAEMEYVAKQSVLYDIKIIILTVAMVLGLYRAGRDSNI